MEDPAPLRCSAAPTRSAAPLLQIRSGAAPHPRPSSLDPALAPLHIHASVAENLIAGAKGIICLTYRGGVKAGWWEERHGRGRRRGEEEAGDEETEKTATRKGSDWPQRGEGEAMGEGDSGGRARERVDQVGW